jgi:hypothetical protein
MYLGYIDTVRRVGDQRVGMQLGHVHEGVVKLSGTGEPGLAKRRESSRMAVSQFRTPA